MRKGDIIMEQSETRSERMQGVREKILTVAKKLFIEQGYKKTTIRQIVQESGVTSGSIYNIFENKDAIFEAIADEIIDVMVDSIEERLSDMDMIYRYAALLGVEWYSIEKEPILRELYYEAFTEPTIFESIIRRNMDLARYYLQDVERLGDFRPEDCYARMVMTKGALLGFIEFFAFRHVGNANNIRRELANITFLSAGIKKKDAKELYHFIVEHEALFAEMAHQALDDIRASE